MKSRIIFLLLCFLVIACSGCGILSKKYLKTATEEHRLNTGEKKRIKLENIHGSILIARSNDSVSMSIKAYKEVKVKKKYLNTPFDEISVDIDTTKPGVIEISTDIEKGGKDDIFRFNMDRKQRVDYELRVPAGIEIEIENISGNVTADNINNDITIDLVNGDVSLDKYTGKVDCEITNGDLTAQIDSTRGINVNTINGGITLHLNNYMNANIRAETVNGRIIQEQLEFKEVIKESKLFKGKLGSGTPDIDISLETVNGKIRLYGRNEI